LADKKKSQIWQKFIFAHQNRRVLILAVEDKFLPAKNFFSLPYFFSYSLLLYFGGLHEWGYYLTPSILPGKMIIFAKIEITITKIKKMYKKKQNSSTSFSSNVRKKNKTFQISQDNQLHILYSALNLY